MDSIYYTTNEVLGIFQWLDAGTITARQKKGTFPYPDLRGRPNKWLKVNIDAMTGAQVDAPS